MGLIGKVSDFYEGTASLHSFKGKECQIAVLKGNLQANCTLIVLTRYSGVRDDILAVAVAYMIVLREDIYYLLIKKG